MGIYLNPGNESFRTIRNGLYVDKTGLIRLINQGIDTKDKLTCVSRPRRFGKSYTAQMLCAYYDRTCDSSSLFSDLTIAGDESYKIRLNSFDVIYLDITGFIASAGGDVSAVPNTIRSSLVQELQSAFPKAGKAATLSGSLMAVREVYGDKFFFIIDEWDALFREAPGNVSAQKEYMELLRELFKNGNFTDRVVAGAYITGILPIKKYGKQSAISDFREYTMMQPAMFAEYVGFTGDEVAGLCEKYHISLRQMKYWYDGYSFKQAPSVYNPNSVSQAVRTGVFDSYWSKTETYEALREYIDRDEEGLQADLILMIGGGEVPVDTSTFQNDMTSIQGKDDVLSLLIHLGYLAYNFHKQSVRIPNEEIRREFVSTVRKGKHEVTSRIIRHSDQLIEDTISGNEEAVAQAIQDAHDAGTFGISPLFYNDEQALRSVVKFAYISCANDYMKIEEMPSGHGYADIVYLPRNSSKLPAMVIELKMDTAPEGALAQIRDRNYPKVFEDYRGEVILVGITYDHKTKKHSCRIEKRNKNNYSEPRRF